MAKKLKLAAAGDIHVQAANANSWQQLFQDMSAEADVLVLCGDLTENGLASEAYILADALRAVRIPVVGVLGNHDFAGDESTQIKEALSGVMVILNDTPWVHDEVGFAGVKGFGGGFERYMLGRFGEAAIRSYVDEAVHEALQLENALQKLETPKKVVLTHYAPIRQTVVGEPEEIFAFLGSSRLVEPIDVYEVDLALHGHAHHGSLEGKTVKGVPVYNVSMPLLQRQTGQPFRVLEV